MKTINNSTPHPAIPGIESTVSVRRGLSDPNGSGGPLRHTDFTDAGAAQ